MRIFASALVAVAIIGLGTAAGTSAQAAQPFGGRGIGSCGPTGARTLAASLRLRVYEGVSPEDKRVAPVLGCMKPAGHPRLLGPLTPDEGYLGGPFVLVGPWAAGVESLGEGVDIINRYSTALNLSTRQRHRCLLGSGIAPNPLRLRHFLLNRFGIAVWVEEIKLAGKRIAACESNGRRLLDKGPGIEVDSVSLQGKLLTWSDSGVEHSAVVR